MKKWLFLAVAVCVTSPIDAHEPAPSPDSTKVETSKKASRLTIGGYGEAVASWNFYSDKYLRYTDAETYKNDNGHGRVDIPHVVIWLGYDFGKGWSMGSEIEFEHGGTGNTIEIEEEEAGEYETEVERGGEVALEQFWLQKSFSKALNLRIGHIVVPVGATNQHHFPTEFFTNYRPEGENTIMPCTWHETGISLWGRIKNWRYEALIIPGLDSDRFDRSGWVHDGGGSPYEFKIANTLAGAFRLDNYDIPGLRLAISGYIGNSFKNTLSATDGEKYKGVHGTVAIGSFDFEYNAHNTIVRGNFDYGHLSDSELITKYNMTMRKDSPSAQQPVASAAIAGGIEAGYDVFAPFARLAAKKQKLFVFGRYEYYDSMFDTEGSIQDYKWCARSRIVGGINYKPMNEIVVKCEYGVRLLDSRYNNEPSLSIGIAYTGLFKH